MDAVAGSVWGNLRAAVIAAADLVLPARCAACPEPGSPLCRSCRAGLRAAGFAGGPRRVGPDPAPPWMPSCWAAARLEGPLRAAVTAYKDQDRRDLAPVLAAVLATALGTAMSREPSLRSSIVERSRVLLVPMPTSRTSRRRRGDDPVREVARRALRLVVDDERSPRLVLAPAVRHTRAVADQSGLGRESRARNLRGALAVDPAWAAVVGGAVCVLADDVVTTGASLTEAARALHRAGAREVVAVTVAATALHRDAADPPR